MLIIKQMYIKISLYYYAFVKILINSLFLIKILLIKFFLIFIDKSCFLNFKLLDYFQIILHIFSLNLKINSFKK